MWTPLLSSLLLVPIAPPDLGGAPDPARVADGLPTSFWWGDYDADGLPDAFVVQPGAPGRLLHNLGDGSFEDATELAGIPELPGAHMALWHDYDGDGQLDLFLASNAAGWLRDAFDRLGEGDASARERVVTVLAEWSHDLDLAGIRDPDQGLPLAAEERAVWRALWAELEDLLASDR